MLERVEVSDKIKKYLETKPGVTNMDLKAYKIVNDKNNKSLLIFTVDLKLLRRRKK